MLINRDTIINDSNPLIREKSLDVKVPLSLEDEKLLNEMLTYVIESTDETIAQEKNLEPAVGISAIQVGVKKKLCAIALRDENGEISVQYALANPKIVSYSIENSYLTSGEGCLSVPNRREGLIKRHARIKVKAYDALKKEDVVIKQDGYLAIAFQHELDHFNGVLYYDHINPDNPMDMDPNAIAID